MNRLLLGVNAVCLAVLIVLIVRQASPVDHPGAAPAAPVVPGPVLHDVTLAADHQVETRGATIVFGEDMVDGATIEAAGGLEGVRLEPDARVTSRWQTPRRLAIHSARLARATAYTVGLPAGLRTLAGHDVKPAEVLRFETARPKFVDAVAADTAAQGLAVTIGFDVAMNPTQLATAIAVTDEAGHVVPVHADSTDGKPTRQVRLRLDVPPSAAPRSIDLELPATLRPAQGDLGLGEVVRAHISFVDDLTVTAVESGYGWIDLGFNHPVSLPPREMITLDPPVPFQVASNWRGTRLLGDFPAGGALAVILAADFPGAGRFRLRESTRRSVFLPDREPSLSLPQHGSILSARARPELEVEAVNLKAFDLSVRPAYTNNLVRLAQAGDDSPIEVFGSPHVRRVNVAGMHNRPTRERVDLAPLIGDTERGAFLVTVSAPDGSASAARLIQFTDLAITARATPNAVAVRVTSLARGEPHPDATVRIFTPTNQELASGTTNREGVALLRCTKSAPDRTPYLVEARVGTDVSFVVLDRHAVTLAEDDLTGRDYVVDGIEAFAALDRGAVRPGETARVMIIVRDGHGRTPSGTALEARWSAPAGRFAGRTPIEVPADGLITLARPIPADAATGTWRIEIVDPRQDRVVGATTFQVDAFVPNRLEGTVTVASDVTTDAPIVVTVDGRWLDGLPAAGQAVRLVPRVLSATQVPAGFEGWSFGPTDSGTPAGAQPALSGVLDERGRATFSVALPAPPRGEQVVTALFVAEIADPSGRAIQAIGRARVWNPSPLIGVTQTSGKIQVAAVDASGKPVAGDVAVTVEMQRRSWHSEVVPLESGRFTWRTTVDSVTESATEVTVRNGAATVTFPPPAEIEDTWCVVSVRHGQARAEQPLGTPPDRPDRVRVTTAAPVSEAGHQVRLLIDSPCAGSAFITLEGTTLHGWKSAPIVRGRTTVDLDLPAQLDLPNLFAVVTVTTPQARTDAHPPFWLVGAAPIRIAHPERALSVGIEAPAECRPETAVDIDVRAPGATRAVVCLTDVGILQITNHPAPDPLGWFLASRRLDSQGADSGTALLSGPRFDPEVLTGGDGDPLGGRLAGTVSPHVRTVALQSDLLTLDERGAARVHFVLPPYEGRLRIVVLAAGPLAVGAARSDLVVRAPLSVLIATPRFIAPGDRATIPVTVRNTSPVALPTHVTFEAIDGATLAVGTSAAQDCDLAAGATQTFAVPVEVAEAADAPGLRCRVSSGELVREVTERFVARHAALLVRESRSELVEGERDIVIPGTWERGSRRLRARLQSATDARLLPPLRMLTGYPYGCVEQTTSRAFAALACRPLVDSSEGDFRGAVLGDIVTTGVDRLFSLQTARGGLAAWPGMREEYEFGSVYGLDFLLAARRRAVEVPADRLERLVARVQAMLAHSDQEPFRVWAAAVLAGAQRPVAPWLTELELRAEDAESRSLLALAWAGLGDREHARRLLPDSSTAPPPREGGGLLRSPLRALAVELRARVSIDPADPRIGELATQIGDRLRRLRDLNTQEVAQAILALTEWQGMPGAGFASEANLTVGQTTLTLRGSTAVDLPAGDGAPIRVRATPRAWIAFDIEGRRMSDAVPVGGTWTLRREIVPGTGPAATRPDTRPDSRTSRSFRRGALYEVRLHVHVDEDAENVLVTSLLPGGFESEPGSVTIERDGGVSDDETPTTRIERRDDRVLVFFTNRVAEDVVIRHQIRAVFAGTFQQPAAVAEALYLPDLRAATGPDDPVVIVP